MLGLVPIASSLQRVVRDYNVVSAEKCQCSVSGRAQDSAVTTDGPVRRWCHSGYGSSWQFCLLCNPASELPQPKRFPPLLCMHCEVRFCAGSTT
jgi:hypothetical protein